MKQRTRHDQERRIPSEDFSEGMQRGAHGSSAQGRVHALQAYHGNATAQVAMRERSASAGQATASVQDTAGQGVSGAGGALPFGQQIQSAFGRHDISGVRAHTGERAAQATEGIGATAFAMGMDVAFGGAPDLHTTAHEAAHVVQQRAGVSLKGGVGQAGDPYEQHADAVADAVVRGESAEGLLDQMAGGGGGASSAVQMKDGDSPAPTPTPGKARPVSAGVGVSTSGLTITPIKWAGPKKFKYVVLENGTVSFTVKPTSKKRYTKPGAPKPAEVETSASGSNGGSSVSTNSTAPSPDVAKGRGTPAQVAAPSSTQALELKAKKKFGSPAFVEGGLKVGTDGTASVGMSYGGEWENAKADLKFKFISLGSSNDKNPNAQAVKGKNGTSFWNVRLLTATPSLTARDIWEEGGVRYEVGARASIEIGPNWANLIKDATPKLAALAAKSHLGKIAASLAGAPLFFLEGGIKTIEAALKNIEAKDKLNGLINKCVSESDRVADAFMMGTVGNPSKAGQLGHAAGARFFQTLLQQAKAKFPNITEAEFRNAINSPEAKSWRGSTRGTVSNGSRRMLLKSIQANPPKWMSRPMLNQLQRSLVSGDSKPSDTQLKGPKLYKKPDAKKPHDPRTPEQKKKEDAEAVKLKARVLAVMLKTSGMGQRLDALHRANPRRAPSERMEGWKRYKEGYGHYQKTRNGSTDDVLAYGGAALQCFNGAQYWFGEGLKKHNIVTSSKK